MFHLWAFVAAVPLGFAISFYPHTAPARAGAIAFGASVAAMFGASALYHRVTWQPRARAWLRRLDHAMIYALIAGTYTPFGLLVLKGPWRLTILTIVWSGAAAAILLKLVWVNAPKWVAAAIGIALGWVAIPALPQVVNRIGAGGLALLAAGGVAYTMGAVVYARRHPNPHPGVFGYHEVFHVLVVVAVACQYAAVAFFLLPGH
jgi:hemolysin III